MTTVFKRIVLLTTLFTIAPAHTKQIGKSTPTVQPTRPAPIQPMPAQPVIPRIPAPVQPTQPVIVQPQPTSVHNTWTSSAGLIYKSGPKLSNRINHALHNAKVV